MKDTLFSFDHTEKVSQIYWKGNLNNGLEIVLKFKEKLSIYVISNCFQPKYIPTMTKEIKVYQKKISICRSMEEINTLIRDGEIWLFARFSLILAE